ncbi:MAG TPA: hypothetical protein VKB59_20790 [Micromonosporaceae bacterium]|nr:hypothetical protein [Micromonosporaceae bacterium]
MPDEPAPPPRSTPVTYGRPAQPSDGAPDASWPGSEPDAGYGSERGYESPRQRRHRYADDDNDNDVAENDPRGRHSGPVPSQRPDAPSWEASNSDHSRGRFGDPTSAPGPQPLYGGAPPVPGGPAAMPRGLGAGMPSGLGAGMSSAPDADDVPSAPPRRYGGGAQVYSGGVYGSPAEPDPPAGPTGLDGPGRVDENGAMPANGGRPRSAGAVYGSSGLYGQPRQVPGDDVPGPVPMGPGFGAAGGAPGAVPPQAFGPDGGPGRGPLGRASMPPRSDPPRAATPGLPARPDIATAFGGAPAAGAPASPVSPGRVYGGGSRVEARPEPAEWSGPGPDHMSRFDGPPPVGGPPMPLAPRPDGAHQSTRRWPRTVAVVAVVLLVIGLGAGALYYTSRPNAPTYEIGACVTHSGDKVVAAACSAPESYKIVSKVSDPSACPDTKNPYVSVNNDKTIYCLAPNSGDQSPSGQSSPSGQASPNGQSTPGQSGQTNPPNSTGSPTQP